MFNHNRNITERNNVITAPLWWRNEHTSAPEKENLEGNASVNIKVFLLVCLLLKLTPDWLLEDTDWVLLKITAVSHRWNRPTRTFLCCASHSTAVPHPVGCSSSSHVTARLTQTHSNQPDFLCRCPGVLTWVLQRSWATWGGRCCCKGEAEQLRLSSSCENVTSGGVRTGQYRAHGLQLFKGFFADRAQHAPGHVMVLW